MSPLPTYASSDRRGFVVVDDISIIPVVADADDAVHPGYNNGGVHVIVAALELRQEYRLPVAAELVLVDPGRGLDLGRHGFRGLPVRSTTCRYCSSSSATTSSSSLSSSALTRDRHLTVVGLPRGSGAFLGVCLIGKSSTLCDFLSVYAAPGKSGKYIQYLIVCVLYSANVVRESRYWASTRTARKRDALHTPREISRGFIGTPVFENTARADRSCAAQAAGV